MNLQHDPWVGDMLALDPSVKSAGIALFRGGKLIAADAIRMSARDGETSLARCIRMASEIVDWIVDVDAKPRILASEWPGKTWRGVPTDLHGLCGVAGAVAGMMSLAMAGSNRAMEAVSMEVQDWSGGLPKNTTVKGAKESPRAKRILSRLQDKELEVWDLVKYNDTIDSVGIGLWILGRLDPVRVYSDGSL